MLIVNSPAPTRIGGKRGQRRVCRIINPIAGPRNLQFRGAGLPVDSSTTFSSKEKLPVGL